MLTNSTPTTSDAKQLALNEMLPTKTDSRRRLNATGATNGEYAKVTEERTETDGFVNEQWVAPEVLEPTPWKTIAIILSLFAGGMICISFALLDWLADKNMNHTDRIWALVIIGILTLIPGGYYFFVLGCVLMNRNGFTMDDIRRLG